MTEEKFADSEYVTQYGLRCRLNQIAFYPSDYDRGRNADSEYVYYSISPKMSLKPNSFSPLYIITCVLIDRN
jgi:hypothetical protein